LLAPDGLGTVEAGVVTAADVSTTQQVTVVASFVQLTSGGEVRQSGSAVLRITPPTGLPAGGAGLCGAGSATLGLAGAGLLLTGLGRRVNLGRARKC
jgi:hypothetical protein